MTMNTPAKVGFLAVCLLTLSMTCFLLYIAPSIRELYYRSAATTTIHYTAAAACPQVIITNHCDNNATHSSSSHTESSSCNLKPISCTFAGHATTEFACVVDVKNDSKVFVSREFVENVAEVYGEYDHSATGGDDDAEKKKSSYHMFLTKYSNYRPLEPYHTSGRFLSFSAYNVEARERVLCVSANYGVPVSLQWNRDGHFYATQIAQFGLQHYSQYLQLLQSSPSSSNKPVSVINIGDSLLPSSKKVACKQIVVADDDDVNNRLDAAAASWQTAVFSVACSKLAAAPCSITLKLDISSFKLPVLLRYAAAAGTAANVKQVKAFVVQDSQNRSVEDIEIVYDISTAIRQQQQLQLVRNLAYDVQRGMILLSSSMRGSQQHNQLLTRVLHDNVAAKAKNITRLNTNKFTLWKSLIDLHRSPHLSVVEICGDIKISEIQLFAADTAAEPHRLNFLHAADWLLHNQRADTGTWPVNATHVILPPNENDAAGLVLQPGWCSAMIQGQALSVLARAHLLLLKTDADAAESYKVTALKALKVFERSVYDNEGGVVSTFLHPLSSNITWYEEYPTNPPIFVLNGFMYALFGLYDAVQAFNSTDAERLLLKGMQSLRTMLPLYDTGSGSWYDLRHFTLSDAVPNRARWDYHVTHITQLLALATIEDDDNGRRLITSQTKQFLNSVAERWIRYIDGYRVPHN